MPWSGLNLDVLARASFAAKVERTDLFAVGVGYVGESDGLQMESHKIDGSLSGGTVTQEGPRNHDALVLWAAHVDTHCVG